MGWDRDVKFEKAYEKLRELYLATTNKRDKDKLAVLLIQIKNGSRIGEAIEAYKKFVESGERELSVRIEKRRDGEKRKILIPSFIERPEEITASLTKQNLWNFAKKIIDSNTHSLRYAFITHMALREGENPAIVAKIIGHKNLSHLLTYIQKKEAENKLREFVLESEGIKE